MTPRTVVVVPARDEQERVGACLRALATQEGQDVEVVLVLDGCTDATADVARAAADGLRLHLVDGPRQGVGHARAAGMDRALELLGGAGVIASTDADSVVAPDWLARIHRAMEGGAAAVGGRIVLDPLEAAGLPPTVLAARGAEAARRLAAVRVHTPAAEHHQFSGASLALTVDALGAAGGPPRVAALEDEALERALLAAGLPIAYRADVRVTTSARTGGHVPRGLAQVLRTATWRAREAARVPAATSGDHDLLRPDGDRGAAIAAALEAGGAEVLVLLDPDAPDALADLLAGPLHADPELVLVRAAEPEPDPLAEHLVRPLLNLHAPELAALTSPLTRSWAVRRAALTHALPAGDAADLAILLDVWAAHALDAIAEVRTPRVKTWGLTPCLHDGALAYELLVAALARLPPAPAVPSAAFTDAAGTRRARLDERRPRARA